jgi:hypothetical protein
MYGFTYGSEIEAADWDTRVELPMGSTVDTQDYTVANSNGLGNDNTKVLNPFGGEVNVVKAGSIEAAVSEMMGVYRAITPYTLNYTCNLHLHVGIPGLMENLNSLKNFASYIYKHQDILYGEILPPIPEPKKTDKAARKRYNKRKQSHRRSLTKKIYDKQMVARSVQEFKDATDPKIHGRWVISRPGVNMNSLWDNGTIEFRHWPACDDKEKLLWAYKWCAEFCHQAMINGLSPRGILANMGGKFIMEEFQPFDHEIDKVFQKTKFGDNTRKVIAKYYKENGFEGIGTLPR